MSNKYYERKAELKPFTTARSDDVRGELDGVQSGFEKLPEPREDGTTGFVTAFTIVHPTEDNHPATKAMVATENEKNTEQDGRLDQVENTLSGLGPVEGRYTTLRYVAADGQDEIILPAQFGALAYVFKNGARKFQTVDFVYDVDTKTLTFTSALALNDVVLVDVGVVPDAVLADLIAIQNDIASKHSDVDTWHTEVEQWQQEVASNTQITVDAKDTAVSAKDEAVDSRNVVVAVFLGPKAAAPTVDNDGNALIEGACYYNSTDGRTYVWVDGSWEVTNLSSTTTVAKSSLTGAALIPKGPTADRPDPTSLPDNVMAFRYNTDLGEWEGIDADGNYSELGGGGVSNLIAKSANYTAESKKAVFLDMSDGTSKVVAIPDGLIDDNWFTINVTNWDGSTSGLTVTLVSTEHLFRGANGKEGLTCVIDRPCEVTFSVKSGYFVLRPAAYGQDADYLRNQLEIDRNLIWEHAELTDTGALFNDGTPKFRDNGVPYVNNKPYPIEVKVELVGTSAQTAGQPASTFLIDGVIEGRCGDTSGQTLITVSFTIPPYATYQRNILVAATSYPTSTLLWSERRSRS